MLWSPWFWICDLLLFSCWCLVKCGPDNGLKLSKCTLKVSRFCIFGIVEQGSSAIVPGVFPLLPHFVSLVFLHFNLAPLVYLHFAQVSTGEEFHFLFQTSLLPYLRLLHSSSLCCILLHFTPRANFWAKTHPPPAYLPLFIVCHLFWYS